MTMSISLVISTRNRARQLQTCLSYIAAIDTALPWELIVIDNGSTDTTPEVLQKFATTVPFPVTLVNEPVPGLGRAHNRGWKRARGDVVAFTDDDCYVMPDFLDKALNVFSDPKIGYCGGRIKLYDISDYPITINESTLPQVFPPYSYFATGVIQGANMIFRRTTLDDIGGFDDCLGPGAEFNCEDADACTRAAFAGWWGAYAPGPTVFHAHGRKTADDVAILRRSYAIGDGAYAAKFMLRHDTRWFFARRWCACLNGLRTAGRWRECLFQIEGSMRYFIHHLRNNRR